jgi:fido (protein-threonine AMPylation protein)
MNSGPQAVSCPNWDEQIPVDRMAEFSVALRAALAAVTALSRTGLLSVDVIEDWHRVLFERFVPLDYYAGNVRQDDANRICLGRDVEVDSIRGAHFREVIVRLHRLMDALRDSISETELNWGFLPNNERAKRVALIIAVAIGDFIRIHPFINGNGRISRLIWRWGLHRFGVPAQVRIAPRPDAPYSTLMKASMQGDDGQLALEILRHLADHPPQQVAP